MKIIGSIADENCLFFRKIIISKSKIDVDIASVIEILGQRIYIRLDKNKTIKIVVIEDEV